VVIPMTQNIIKNILKNNYKKILQIKKLDVIYQNIKSYCIAINKKFAKTRFNLQNSYK
jgi:translation elongation factor EF-G